MNALLPVLLPLLAIGCGPSTSVIQLQVVDPDGTPIRNGHVEVGCWQGRLYPWPAMTDVAVNVAGEATLSVQDCDTISILARAPGRAFDLVHRAPSPHLRQTLVLAEAPIGELRDARDTLAVGESWRAREDLRVRRVGDVLVGLQGTTLVGLNAEALEGHDPRSWPVSASSLRLGRTVRLTDELALVLVRGREGTWARWVVNRSSDGPRLRFAAWTHPAQPPVARLPKGSLDLFIAEGRYGRGGG